MGRGHRLDCNRKDGRDYMIKEKLIFALFLILLVVGFIYGFPSSREF